MKNRKPTIDGDIAYVPLGRNAEHGFCKLYYADYNYLIGRGVSGNWTLLNGYPCVTVQGLFYEPHREREFTNPFGAIAKTKAAEHEIKQGKPRKEYIARLLMNAKDEEVRYADGDRLNLLRENLSKHPREFGTIDASKGFKWLGHEAPIDPTGSQLKELAGKFLDPNQGVFKKYVRKPHPPRTEDTPSRRAYDFERIKEPQGEMPEWLKPALKKEKLIRQDD